MRTGLMWSLLVSVRTLNQLQPADLRPVNTALAEPTGGNTAGVPEDNIALKVFNWRKLSLICWTHRPLNLYFIVS